MQTQQFREKLSLNTVESKKLKNLRVNKIYTSRNAIGKSTTNATPHSQKSKASDLKEKCKAANDRQSVKSDVKKKCSYTQKGTASVLHKGSLNKKAEKNYLAINKLSVKDTKQSKKADDEKLLNQKSTTVMIKV